MNKVYWVNFEYFICLTDLSFLRELQLIDYQDLTQDTLLICLDLNDNQNYPQW